MRNLLALVGLVVVGFLGGGWYFGWYAVSWRPGTDGKEHVQFDVDTQKMADDAKRARAKVGDVLADARKPAEPAGPAQKAADKVGQATDQVGATIDRAADKVEQAVDRAADKVQEVIPPAPPPAATPPTDGGKREGWLKGLFHHNKDGAGVK